LFEFTSKSLGNVVYATVHLVMQSQECYICDQFSSTNIVAQHIGSQRSRFICWKFAMCKVVL